jgi:hypothetical protein
LELLEVHRINLNILTEKKPLSNLTTVLERSVWTDRMLDALDKGVKGGVWFSLIDKVYRPATLYAAWLVVKANRGSAGSDRQSIQDFERNLTDNRTLFFKQQQWRIIDFRRLDAEQLHEGRGYVCQARFLYFGVKEYTLLPGGIVDDEPHRI